MSSRISAPFCLLVDLMHLKCIFKSIQAFLK